MTQQYAFVIDKEGKRLSPTKANKAWCLIRKGRAELVEQFPMVIRLNKAVPKYQIDDSEKVLGIDDGAKEVGFAIVQKCKPQRPEYQDYRKKQRPEYRDYRKTKNKVIFKATMQQRQDVNKKMELRSGYRRYRRSHKRYRPKRFNNRLSSRRFGRLPPTIKQKKQAILRVVKKLSKYIRFDKIVLEDVAIDIRVLTEGQKLYEWQYQHSNPKPKAWVAFCRLDENLRKATKMRDEYTCQMCRSEDTVLQAHHIIPTRDSGPDSIHNLITLCLDCHDKVTLNEYEYKDQFLDIIGGREFSLRPAMHVMQGKTYLREELAKIANLEVTTGGDTANRRIDYEISKSHSNDAICVTGLLPVDMVNIKEWLIKPLRKKKKNLAMSLKGFKHRDIVKYTKRDGTTYIGQITALRVKNDKYNSKVCNFRTFEGETFRGYGLNNLELISRPKGLMFI